MTTVESIDQLTKPIPTCHHCGKSLSGQKYTMREELAYCLTCFDLEFADVCEACNTKISCGSKNLCYNDKHWHDKCFNCSSCGCSLASRSFRTHEEAIFCPDCHDNQFAPLCDICRGPLKVGMKKFQYKERQFHEECFRCSECHLPIGTKNFMFRDPLAVCDDCYAKTYAQHCDKCNKIIDGSGVTFNSKALHTDCFTCTNCNTPLTSVKFISKHEEPYCLECYGELFSKKCFKCSKPITGIGGSKFVSYDDREWHSDCFTCTKCNVCLAGKGFLIVDNAIRCADCED